MKSDQIVEYNTNNKIKDQSVLPIISNFRSTAAQCCASGALYLLMFSYGTTLGYGTILVAELSAEDSEIPASMEDLTWISSINYFALPISSIFGGIITKYVGYRNMIRMLSIPIMAAWLIYYYSTTMAIIFLALYVTGTVGGLLESPIFLYIGDITEPRIRGALASGSSAACSCGFSLQTLLIRFFNWRQMALVNIIFPIGCFIAMSLVPENPHWLASKGRFDEAKAALAWLRGWTTPAHVDSEFEILKENIQASTASINNIDAKYQNNFLKQRLYKVVKLYSQRTTLIPFLIACFAFLIRSCNGTYAMQIYAVMIFKDVHSPIEEYTALSILGLLHIIASILVIFIIPYLGKRKLTFFSLIFIGLSYVVVAIYLVHFNEDTVDINLRYMSTILILLAGFVYNLGIGLIPWILASEFFPMSVRHIASGLLAGTAYMFSALSNKMHLYIVEFITLSGTLILYALVNFVGLVVLYIILPETEGRTLKEIEEYFAGTGNLKKPNKKIVSNEKFTLNRDQF